MKGFLELVKKGTPAQVQEAIDAGADVSTSSSFGWTPLMLAAGGNTGS